MPQAAQQITICPECEGWGKHKDGTKECKKCQGRGFYIKSGSQLFAFELPTFVDFQSRKKGFVVKGALYAGCVTVLIILVIILIVAL